MDVCCTSAAQDRTRLSLLIFFKQYPDGYRACERVLQRKAIVQFHVVSLRHLHFSIM